MKPKFRALDRLTGKMFPVGIIDYSIQSVYIEEPNEMYCERDFDEIDLMEFTGLKDKNDVEIYEGDLVRYIDGVKEITCPVKFIKEYACFGVEWRNGLLVTFEYLESVYIELNNLEVVGNIYDNPDY